MWSSEASSRRREASVLLASSLFLALALSGCASSGEKAAGPTMWDRTVQGISSAYETTKSAVSSTVRRIVNDQSEGWQEMQQKEKGAAPPKPDSPAVRPAPSEDRFPAGRSAPREQTVGRSGGQTRDPENRRIALLPRIPQTPEQIRARMEEIDRILSQEKDPAARQRLGGERERLASALQTSLEEESLIREMERLRARLRRLQDRLNEVQRARQ